MKHKIAQVDGLEDSDLETPKEPDESKLKNGKVNVKEAEELTDPVDVTVKVKKVSKIYKITVKDSLQERIDEELEMFWERTSINEFSVKADHKNFYVEVDCWDFKKDFTAYSAASLLESLPWPDGFSVTSSKPTTYLAQNP